MVMKKKTKELRVIKGRKKLKSEKCERERE